MPKCTVAIPIYNRKDMIDDTLKSVLTQSCLDIEVLLIDDCSTDGVWEKLASYNDTRIRRIRNKTNIGLFANFNRCLSLSSGEYIRILCNDDQLNHDTLRMECEFLDSNPEVVLLNTTAKLVGCSDKFLDYTGRDIPEGIYKGHEAIRKALQLCAVYRNPFSCPSAIMLRASVIEEHKLRFDESMKMTGDLSLYLEVLEHGDLAVLHAVGATVKAHSGSAGFKQKLSSAPLAEMVYVTKRYLPYLFKESEGKILLNNLAGRLYGYALVWYIRGYRDEARNMFQAIEELGIDKKVRFIRALRYLSLELNNRIRKLIIKVQ